MADTGLQKSNHVSRRVVCTCLVAVDLVRAPFSKTLLLPALLTKPTPEAAAKAASSGSRTCNDALRYGHLQKVLLYWQQKVEKAV